jgi:threonine dehydratase
MTDSNFINDIEQIRKSYLDLVHFTPLEKSNTFSKMTDNEVYLKLENLQRTGSFKIRGALNKISRLNDEQKKTGVITASAGNHGQAVAFAATLSNINATIVVPEGAPIVKIEAIKNYGGNVVEHGKTYDDAYQKALEIQEKEGLTFISAFNDLDVIMGQATIGFEVLVQLLEVDYIFCPIGGGGLLSGIARYCKEVKSDIKIIGVQSTNASAMYDSFKNKKLVKTQSKDTICDGIAIKQPGDITFDMIQKYVDDIVLVSDEEVADAILLLLERAKIFVEGAGAAGLAALLSKKVDVKNKKVVAIISGGNLTPNLLNRILEKGLIKQGRLLRVKTKLPDVPGALLKVLKIIAEQKGNVVSIIHERQRLELAYNQADVIIEIETRNKEHIEQILSKMKEQFQVEIVEF